MLTGKNIYRDDNKVREIQNLRQFSRHPPPPPSRRGKGLVSKMARVPEGEMQHKYYTMQFLNEEIYADININILIFLLGCVHDDAGLLASGM